METRDKLSYSEFETDHESYKDFWGENPNILFSPHHISELFPTSEMGFYQNLNAISRSVILITIMCTLYTKNIKILITGILTLGSIYLLYYYTKLQKQKMESFSTKDDLDDEELKSSLQSHEIVFDKPSSLNPFSNVLLPDIDENPNKFPAPPTFDNAIEENIIESAKQMVMEQNDSQEDLDEKLFRDLGDKFIFEQSLQPFYPNPSTTLPNDQAAFVQFCYGSMISCKEGNQFACARNLERYTN